MGGYAVNPGGLHGAADQTRDAAATDEAAASTFDDATVDAAAFGPSGPAADLASKWHAAVAARSTESTRVAKRTSDMADLLDAAADEYSDQDHTNARTVRAAA